MATIGLSKPYIATYNSVGDVVTYNGGCLVGKAVEMNIELEGGDTNILYADNGPAESDSQFAGGTLTLITDDLYTSSMLKFLGLKTEKITGDGITTPDASWIIYDSEQNIPYVGFGAIIKKKIANEYKYVAVALPKIQFTNPGDSAVTQGETVEWQTPELTATIMRDDTALANWKRISTPLDTEKEAELAIQAFLNITLEPLTVVSVAGGSSGDTKITVTPKLDYGNSYVYKTSDSETEPKYNEICDAGYTAWDGTSDITATTGDEILIVEVNLDKQARKAGKATVTSRS